MTYGDHHHDALRDVAAVARRRIERAQETEAALAELEVDPGLENVAALHRLHARHLREDGDLEGAARAEERAERVEALIQRRRSLQPADETPA